MLNSETESGTPPISVTVENACKITGLGRSSIYELMKQNKIKSVAVGRRRLVIYASLRELITSAAA